MTDTHREAIAAKLAGNRPPPTPDQPVRRAGQSPALPATPKPDLNQGRAGGPTPADDSALPVAERIRKQLEVHPPWPSKT